MAWYDIFRAKKFKRELASEKAKNKKLVGTLQKMQARYKAIRQRLSTLEAMEAFGLREAIVKLTSKKDLLEARVKVLDKNIGEKEAQIIQLDEAILLQSFGLYETRYEFEDSSMYKHRLDKIRSEQKKMIKDGTATVKGVAWTIGGSEAEGKKMIKDFVKLILRSFNNECDATIIKAKYNNIESLEKKINKAAKTLNKLGERMSISIKSKYLNLKIQELYLSYEYELKKQAEKEEQRQIKAQIREEAKVQREIEKAKKKLRKEATHFKQAISSLDEQLDQTQDDAGRQRIVEEKAKIEHELEKVTVDIASNEMREKNTRAGHVYIISNVGSFGENIYKIGMTKRLDPQDRVDELGDSSVPYRFDVHAMIFSEDAPSLENALHHTFADRRLNLVNRRREFFSVSLDQIERVVKENFNKPVEFIRTAKADEYRQSEQMRIKIEQDSLQQVI